VPVSSSWLFNRADVAVIASSITLRLLTVALSGGHELANGGPLRSQQNTSYFRDRTLVQLAERFCKQVLKFGRIWHLLGQTTQFAHYCLALLLGRVCFSRSG
jgi:hypothetical protein